MTTERNQVLIFSDVIHLMADVRSSTTSHNQAVESGLRAWIKQSGGTIANNKQKNHWYFLIRRESILMNRGKGGSATDRSRISSIGYLAPLLDMEGKLDRFKHMYGGKDLRDVWQAAGPWNKKQLLILSIMYQDSKLSGIIARRAIEQNHFIDAKLNEDAKARFEKKDPANPNLVAGSWEDYTEVDYENVLAKVGSQMRTASREFRDAANARGEFYKGTSNFQQKF